LVVRAPRVNDKRIDEETGERKRFASANLPAWCLRPRVGAVPRLVGRAVRLDDHPVMRAVPRRAGRLAKRDLSGVDYVYCWADGIHVTVRLEEHKQCLLVLIGCARTAPRS
jgi:hypothetical protein